MAAFNHVGQCVTDLERSKRFYGELLGLHEIERPPFGFPGAWFSLGDGQLHLVADGQRDVVERLDFEGHARAQPMGVSTACALQAVRSQPRRLIAGCSSVGRRDRRGGANRVLFVVQASNRRSNKTQS